MQYVYSSEYSSEDETKVQFDNCSYRGDICVGNCLHPITADSGSSLDGHDDEQGS